MTDQAHTLRVAMIRRDTESQVRIEQEAYARKIDDLILQSRALTRRIAARNQAEREVLQRIEDRSGL